MGVAITLEGDAEGTMVELFALTTMMEGTAHQCPYHGLGLRSKWKKEGGGPTLRGDDSVFY